MARADLVGAFLADTPADSLGILTAQEHRLYHDFFHNDPLIHRLRSAQRQPDLFHEAGKAEARDLAELEEVA